MSGPCLHERPASTLVIGYGNPLRRDDAAGRRVAEVVSGWGVPGVTALEVHQLTPELAEPIAAADLAIFVDATVAGEDQRVRGVIPGSLGDATFPSPQPSPARGEGWGEGDHPNSHRPWNDTGGVRAIPIEPSPHGGTMAHTGDPSALLDLAERLFGGHREAWLVSIPAPDLGFGEELSEIAERGVAEALQWIAARLGVEGRTCTRSA